MELGEVKSRLGHSVLDVVNNLAFNAGHVSSHVCFHQTPELGGVNLT